VRMGIQFHPGQGVVVICDYSTGFIVPEMVKRRPAIVICKQMKGRPGLCTVVPLSTTEPDPILDHHAEIELPFALPAPFDAKTQWIKGDMINAVSFDRLNLISLGKDSSGKRRYLTTPIGDQLLEIVQRCVMKGVSLTK
jgi:mRNA interferase MazF